MRAWPIAFEAFGNQDRFATDGKAELVMKDQALKSIRWSLTACDFYAVNFVTMARLLSIAMQEEYTEKDLAKIGRRIWTLTRLINLGEGCTREDDSLPPRISDEPLPDGPARGHVVPRADFEKMLSEYYKIWGWDEQGRPTRETMQELDLA